MHDTFAMQFAHSQHNLHSVELDHLFGQSLLFLKDLVKLATPDEGHNEVEPCLCLEQEVHAYQEGVIHSKKNIFFKLGALYLVVFYENIFADHFNSVFLPSGCQYSEIDLAEGASADLGLQLEIL